MGNVAEPKTKTIGVKVSASLYDAVKAKAELKSTNVSALIRKSLEAWVKREA